MAQINLLYVQHWRDKKTGQMQYRYRRKGMKSVALRDAGLEGRSPHGLRKAAGRR